MRLKVIKLLFKSEYLWVGLILILSLWFRTYKIDRPIADWHSWRQADTAAVARNFVKDGFNLLAPKFDDLSPLSDKQLPNPQGYRYVEFPFYSLVVSLAWLIFPFQEWIARLVSISFSLWSILFLFLICRRFFGSLESLIITAIFAFLPYNIFYSTVILPEPLLVLSVISALFFIDLWFEKKNSLFANFSFGFLSISFLSVGLLTKPVALFLIPAIVYLAYFRIGTNFLKSPKLWLIIIMPLLPFFFWRMIAAQHPEGIPAFWWLLNGSQIRLKGAFFYWIIQDRLNRMILSSTGFALLIIGLLSFKRKGELFFLYWLLGMIFYIIVFATGNVTHDYYQVPLLPVLSVFVGRGFVHLLSYGRSFLSRLFYVPLALFLLALMFALTWREDRTLFNINNPKIVEVGRLADRILPSDTKVIAPYGGDTAFLYQINRKGWPVLFTSIDEMKKLGAEFYVTVSIDNDAQKLLKDYRPIIIGDDFAIIDIR